jgi:hypothetical protein
MSVQTIANARAGGIETNQYFQGGVSGAQLHRLRIWFENIALSPRSRHPAWDFLIVLVFPVMKS